MEQQSHSPRHVNTSGLDTASNWGVALPPIALGNRLLQAIFVLLMLAMLALPLVLMPFVPADPNVEKRELAEAPRLMDESGPNLSFLKDSGDFFADHFAFRSELVDLDASMRQHLFLTSAVPNVIVGTNGWLYYSGELGDYQRTGQMSDKALANAARNLALVQEYLQQEGKHFALVIAPNKSTVYPERMPYYLLQGEGPSNLERLMPLLDAHGVNVVDVAGLIAQEQEVRYFARDSHWNDQGALVAYDALMRSLERQPLAFDYSDMQEQEHLGDLDVMLHPVSACPECQQLPGGLDSFLIANDATNESAYIVTSCMRSDQTGNLLVYRDSFANNLMQPLAATYAQAVFTKQVPYNLGSEQIGFAQDVIIERAERHLSSFASDPPYMPAPARVLEEEGPVHASKTSVRLTHNGPYLVVEGTLDATVASSEGSVFVRLALADGSMGTYECFRVSSPQTSGADFEGEAVPEDSAVEGDDGYRAFIPIGERDAKEPTHVRILVGTTQEACEVACLACEQQGKEGR